MKIIAWISPINDIKSYINSEIDEFFCWYIPFEWFYNYGFEISLNRRYKYEQQFTSQKIFEKLLSTLKKHNKKLYITLNEQFYTNKQFPLIKKYTNYLETTDIDWIIVADIHLLSLLSEQNFQKEIHLSWDFWIYNTDSLEFILKNFKNLNIKRIIFPRESLINEMKETIDYIKRNWLNIETEAFILWDPCIFNWALCRASHGYWVDGLCYTIKYNKSDFSKKITEDLTKWGKKCWICIINKLKEIWIDSLKIPWRWNNFLQEINSIIDIVKWKKDYKKEKEEIIKKYWKNYCNGNNCYYSLEK